MMDERERELERAIDTAAASMMSHEPSRALSYTVMAGVHEDVKPSLRGRVWAMAAASVVLCAAIAAALISRVPQTLPGLPAAPPFAVAQLPTIAEPPIVTANDIRRTRRITSAPVAVASRAAPAAAFPVDVSPIEPIAPEPIVVAAIGVPQLEPEARVAIEALEIDELTIEPIAASN